MGTIATFTTELLGDGHLSIPEKVVKALSLKKGEKVKAVIEAEKFDYLVSCRPVTQKNRFGENIGEVFLPYISDDG